MSLSLSAQQVNKINSICRSLKLGNVDKFNADWPVWLVVDVLLSRLDGLRAVTEAQAKQIKQLQTTIQNVETQLQNVARQFAITIKK